MTRVRAQRMTDSKVCSLAARLVRLLDWTVISVRQTMVLGWS